MSLKGLRPRYVCEVNGGFPSFSGRRARDVGVERNLCSTSRVVMGLVVMDGGRS